MTIIYSGAFLGLYNLLVLNISNNGRLQHIQPQSLNGLGLLRHLDMSNTLIEALHADLLTDLDSLDYVDLSGTKFLKLEFVTFRTHQGLYIHLTAVQTLAEINMTIIANKWASFTMVTDLVNICCFVSLKINCTVPNTNISVCFSPLDGNVSIIVSIVSVLCVILSIWSIIQRMHLPNKDKIMISTLLTDLILAMTILLLTILRNYFLYLQGTFRQLLYYDVDWCFLPAGLQLSVVLGQVFVVTYISYAYYSGLKDGPYRSKLQVIISMTTLIAGFSITRLVYTGLYHVNGLATLTHTCSFIWPGQKDLTLMEQILFHFNRNMWIISMGINVWFFTKANKLVTKSAEAFSSLMSSRAGGEQSHAVVVFFMKTVFIPITTSIIPVVSQLLLWLGVKFPPMADIVLSMIILPAGSILNSLYFLCREMKRRQANII